MKSSILVKLKHVSCSLCSKIDKSTISNDYMLDKWKNTGLKYLQSYFSGLKLLFCEIFSLFSSLGTKILGFHRYMMNFINCDIFGQFFNSVSFFLIGVLHPSQKHLFASQNDQMGRQREGY